MAKGMDKAKAGFYHIGALLTKSSLSHIPKEVGHLVYQTCVKGLLKHTQVAKQTRDLSDIVVNSPTRCYAHPRNQGGQTNQRLKLMCSKEAMHYRRILCFMHHGLFIVEHKLKCTMTIEE